MFMQESVFAHLSIKEKECILNVPAAKHLDDLQMFVRLFPYFNGNHHIEEILFCLFCCFTSQVNSYGHGGTVSSPNHTFSWASLNNQLTSTSCTYFRL